jgi:uncharacterized protein
MINVQNRISFYSQRAVLCVTLLWLSSGVALGQTSPSALPAKTGNAINDFANVIDQATTNRLETMMINLKRNADIEFAVVTVPTTGELTAFDYTLRLAREWGIGPSGGEQKGLILLVAVNDRKYQIQPSRHLQGDLPDGLVGEIGREMREPFRRNDYSTGITNAVETIIATLAEKRGFSIEGIDRRRALRDTTPRDSSGGGSSCSPCVIIFVVLFIILILLSNRGNAAVAADSVAAQAADCLTRCSSALFSAIWDAAAGQADGVVVAVRVTPDSAASAAAAISTAAARAASGSDPLSIKAKVLDVWW